MIITCPSCKKKFEIDGNLIPKEGRNLQCGSCLSVWFYKFEQNSSDLKIQEKTKNISEENVKRKILSDVKKSILNNKKDNSDIQNDKALVKYQKKSKLSISNFIGYFLVIVISFVALIIVLDTFQALLSPIFPNLELILFNFYETLIDIYLFIKDLIRQE